MENSFINLVKSTAIVPTDQEEKLRSLISNKQLENGSLFIKEGEYPSTLGYVRIGFV